MARRPEQALKTLQDILEISVNPAIARGLMAVHLELIKKGSFPLEEHDYDPKLEPMFLLMMLECGDPTGKAWSERQWEAFNDILATHKLSPMNGGRLMRGPPAKSGGGIHGTKTQKNLLTQYAVWYIREHNRRQEKAQS